LGGAGGAIIGGIGVGYLNIPIEKGNFVSIQTKQTFSWPFCASFTGEDSMERMDGYLTGL
jgi:hypothetical protein